MGTSNSASKSWSGRTTRRTARRSEEDVGERLSDIAESETEDDLFSDRLALNRSYLVATDDREAFDDAVGELREEYDELTVQYTGPWAPYNFVDIHIGAQR